MAPAGEGAGFAGGAAEAGADGLRGRGGAKWRGHRYCGANRRVGWW
ncbi:MAG: hypothetical protein ABR910_13465 [Acidobacteriaceae bacterium]